MVTYCSKFGIPTPFAFENIGLTNSLKKVLWSTLKFNISKIKNAETFKLGNNVDLESINLQTKNQLFISTGLDLKRKKTKIKLFCKNSKILPKTMRFCCAFIQNGQVYLS